tara:strand:+ start:312 stop:437 length:126 start_codon:yes stop_codon:yes gene_type:complete
MAWNVEREIFKDFLKNIPRARTTGGSAAAETKSDARPVTPF